MLRVNMLQQNMFAVNIFAISLFVLCSSRKNPYPPHGRSLEIPRERGVLTANILEAKYQAKLEFPGGTGVLNKKSVGGL